ncbi:uncharacterized protein QC764_709818 [Podospora pseudoanserina]|uniref:Uncharacterized protein n=1 Tax=Podospora pseudoanserina TaxID=2609844 RepID=A0ABR0HKV4_9PEZI|nr:hypothetical protein QC764_709818 [Podospora pseudoanserina]
MNVTPLARRPLSCLKTSLLRQARQQKMFSRSMATEVQAAAAAATSKTPSQGPDQNFYRLVDKKNKSVRSAFALYPNPSPPPASPSPPPPPPTPSPPSTTFKSKSSTPPAPAPPSSPAPARPPK